MMMRRRSSLAVATTTLLALAATTPLPMSVAADEAVTSMSSAYRPRRLRAAPSRQLQDPAASSSSPPDAADLCVAELDWTSEGGEILVNGQPLHLKGTSYFGFETPNEGTLVSKPLCMSLPPYHTTFGVVRFTIGPPLSPHHPSFPLPS